MSSVAQQYVSGLPAQRSGPALPCVSTGVGVRTAPHSPQRMNATAFFLRPRFSGADSCCPVVARRASVSSRLRARSPAATSSFPPRGSRCAAQGRRPGCARQPPLLLSLR